MFKAIRLFLTVIATFVLSGISVAGIGLGVASLTLPASACTVTEAQTQTLVLEKMSQADVLAKLGCDGVHKVQLASDQLHMETISWRGEAWPYARFDGHFINGVLHGTEKRWFSLKVTL